MGYDWEDRGAFIIPAFIFIILALAAFGPNIRNLDWGMVLDNGEKLFTIIGIIVGGIWTYYGLIKGRVYRHRLEPSISGEILDIDGLKHLIVKLQLKNVGASKITILDSSGLDIFSDQTHLLPKEEKQILDFENAPWSEPPTTFPVFSGHQWIEPGETIQDEKIIALRAKGKALLKLELHIDTDRITTSAVTIIRLGLNPSQARANRHFFE